MLIDMGLVLIACH